MSLIITETGTIETKEDLDEVERGMDGRVVFQRLGAVTGEVRLNAAGDYVVSGACTLDDVQAVDPRTKAELLEVAAKAAVRGELPDRPAKPVEEEPVVDPKSGEILTRG